MSKSWYIFWPMTDDKIASICDRSADLSLDITRVDDTRPTSVRPIYVITVRTEKYVANTMTMPKHNQNHMERFMRVIIS